MSKDLHIKHSDGGHEIFFDESKYVYEEKYVVDVCANCHEKCSDSQPCYCCKNNTRWNA